MLDLYEYETATKEQLEVELEEIVGYLDKYLTNLCNRGLDSNEINALEKKGERIIELAKRLEELEEEFE